MTMADVTLEQVHAYLGAHGWRRRPDDPPGREHWQHPVRDYPDDGMTFPSDDQGEEWHIYLSGMIETFAAREGVCEHEVLAELLGRPDPATLLKRISDLRSELQQQDLAEQVRYANYGVRPLAEAADTAAGRLHAMLAEASEGVNMVTIPIGEARELLAGSFGAGRVTAYAPTPADLDEVEALAADNPMPPGLRKQIARWIEPQTLNTGTDHRGAMDVIAVAYPLIRAHLAEAEPFAWSGSVARAGDCIIVPLDRDGEHAADLEIDRVRAGTLAAMLADAAGQRSETMTA